MNFAPHHNFTACERLEKIVEALRLANSITPAVYDDFSRYHFSLLHKLQSARYHVETLTSYLASQNARQSDPHSVVYRVNFHFDGFLHVLGSALDILAREILCCFAMLPQGNVHFHTASQVLTAARPNDTILPLLASPPWRQEFSAYRNTATHESIVGRSYTVSIEVIGHKSVTRVVFPIPDDPRAVPVTCTRNQDIVKYCSATFKRVLSHTNQLYAHIEERSRIGGTLPL